MDLEKPVARAPVGDMLVFKIIFRPIGVFNTRLWTKERGIKISPSVLSENVLWFVDSSGARFSTCRKCRVDFRCEKCLEKYRAQVLLLHRFPAEKIKTELLKMKEIKMQSINDALYLYDLRKSDFEVLTNSRLRYLENKYSTHFYFYKSVPGRFGYSAHLLTLRKPFGKKFSRKFHFKLEGDLPLSRNGIIDNMTLLLNSELKTGLGSAMIFNFKLIIGTSI